jgi:hypothetical protein
MLFNLQWRRENHRETYQVEQDFRHDFWFVFIKKGLTVLY